MQQAQSSGKEKAREVDVKEWESVSVSLGPGSTRASTLAGTGSPSTVEAKNLVAGEEQAEPAKVLLEATVSHWHYPLPPSDSRLLSVFPAAEYLAINYL